MNEIKYYSLHNHTDYSNLRLVDCINKYDALIQYAKDLGLGGVAITDHEALCSHVKALHYVDGKRKKDKDNKEGWQDFKLILGNEIYLCRDGMNNTNFRKGEDDYFHFILLAKDRVGHEQLQELSSRAWMRGYMSFMMRVPTYYYDIEEVIGANPGHVIASTACLGGWVPKRILKYGANSANKSEIVAQICDFVDWCQEQFGKENFFLEMQPSDTEEQVFVNNELIKISQALEVPLIITTDSHYLRKEDRAIHKAYLNSDNGDREVDSFYATTYMMNSDEIHKYMDKHIGAEQVDEALKQTIHIGEMCENYSLDNIIQVPYIPQRQFSRLYNVQEYFDRIPALKLFWESPHDCDWHFAQRIVETIRSDKFYTKDGRENERYERINTELQVTWDSAEKQGIRWSAYMLQEADYVQLFWTDGNSLVGPGRGSGASFYLNYLIDITQIDPTRETAPMKYWRFINPERASVLDIDVDIEGYKRDFIIEAMQRRYGADRVIRVCTFGTEKAKRAIQTACRGLGIDNDIGQYLGSMITSERGIQHTLAETYYGDVEKGLAPNKDFVREMTDNYPQVWEIAQKIEGLVCTVGIHAGGVVIVDEPFTKKSAIMKTKKGILVSQFELHDEESLGHIKIDLLAVEAMDKIRACLDLLVKAKYIQPKATLREVYEEAIGVYNLERLEPKMWKMIWENKIFSIFQMDQASGVQGIALTKPRSVEDLATLNSVIRLMASEKGAEQPLNKYARFRQNPNDWEEEMVNYGLSDTEKQLIREYLTISCGICECQESMMSLLLEPTVAGWSLAQVDKVRKSVAKKNPKEFKDLTEQFFQNAADKKLSKNLTNYVWNVLVMTQKGYSFNLSHTFAYSVIGLQEMNLAYKYPIIFWNCANLIVDSGAADEINDDNEDEPEETDEEDEDVEEEESKKKSNKSTDYGKISKAIGKMRKHGIGVELPDINYSDFGFSVDVERNLILYGIKGITRIGSALVKEIIANRPYVSIIDFMNKVKVNKVQMSNLIKSGCFDSLCSGREEAMSTFLDTIADTKSRLTLQNMPGLIREGLIPDEMSVYAELFEFNKFLKSHKRSIYYLLTDSAVEYYAGWSDLGDVFTSDNGEWMIKQSDWDKKYKRFMEPMRQYLKDPQYGMLEKVNGHAKAVMAEKYAAGSVSRWEMDSVGFYYHDHELADDYAKGGIGPYELSRFENLPEEPSVEYMVHTKKNQDIPIFKLSCIAGTVINKDKNKHIVTILTDTEVVNVKVWDAQFTKYDKQISERGEDGKKHVIEKSWFTRGNKLIFVGIRRGDNFIPKVYRNAHCPYPVPIMKLDDVYGILTERVGEEEE